MENMKIFYSWKNDSDNNYNRNFIEKSLKAAIQNISNKLFLEEAANRIEIDHDTKSVPGTPDITSTIFDKISNSTIFIADLTMISRCSSHRKTPNPNVLIELGYAISKIGSDRIICIMNTAYGSINDLPFDLKHKRCSIQYKLNESVDNNSDVKHTLIKNFENEIKPIIELQKYQKNNLQLSANPSFDQILDIILASDSKDDWKNIESPLTQLKRTLYFKKNVNLRFEMDCSKESMPFSESWATRYPDKKATKETGHLYYCSTHIDSYILIAVDGGRAL